MNEGLQTGTQFRDAYRALDEYYFKQTVIQYNLVGRKGFHASHGNCVAHHTVIEIVLNHLVVVFDLQMIGGDGRDGGDSGDNICQMTESVFEFLGSIVSNFCECTKGCYIDERGSVKPATVNVPMDSSFATTESYKKLMPIPAATRALIEIKLLMDTFRKKSFKS